MPPKKATTPGAALVMLDINQEGLSLREAQNQKRKATSPTPQEEELDQEIRDLMVIHQQEKERENALASWTSEEDWRSYQRNVPYHARWARTKATTERVSARKSKLWWRMVWWFPHGNFAFDDASSLVAELKATPWPLSYKPPQLPMYDGHSDPKQILMSYEATISSYDGNTTVMAKSFVMVVRSVAQTWFSSLCLGTIMSWQKQKDMLVTSFQGFQTKPVTAQALFQCT
jgi:hypothetical protein